MTKFEQQPQRCPSLSKLHSSAVRQFISCAFGLGSFLIRILHVCFSKTWQQQPTSVTRSIYCAHATLLIIATLVTHGALSWYFRLMGRNTTAVSPSAVQCMKQSSQATLWDHSDDRSLESLNSDMCHTHVYNTPASTCIQHNYISIAYINFIDRPLGLDQYTTEQHQHTDHLTLRYFHIPTKSHSTALRPKLRSGPTNINRRAYQNNHTTPR